MNELFDKARQDPAAALSTISPTKANTFRFVFIWPAVTPLMTYERVGRSFAERFIGFADRLKLLATGFCLSSNSMYFGTANYGGQAVNVAYREIEVRYKVGRPSNCAGRYVSVDELDRTSQPAANARGYGAGPILPIQPAAPPPPEPKSPEDGLKPFLRSPGAAQPR